MCLNDTITSVIEIHANLMPHVHNKGIFNQTLTFGMHENYKILIS